MKTLRAKNVERFPGAGSSLADAIAMRAVSTWAGVGDADAAPVDPVGSVRRCRSKPAATLAVQAQMALARAALAGAGLATPKSQHFLAFLTKIFRHFLSRDGGAGLPDRMAADGEVIEPKRTLRGHAWMVRALAEAYAVTRAGEMLLLADLILDYLDARLGDRTGGYFEDDQGSGERLQSSHAVLADAMLTLHAATGSPAHLARARGLLDLFAERFYDASQASMGERFDRRWRRQANEADQQPAALARWVVLLRREHDACGDTKALALMRQAGARLLSLRDERGLLPHFAEAGVSFRLNDQILLCGALQALAEDDNGLHSEMRFLESRIAALFIQPAPAGCWCESLDSKGASLGAPIAMETLAAITAHLAERARRQPASRTGGRAIHAA